MENTHCPKTLRTCPNPPWASLEIKILDINSRSHVFPKQTCLESSWTYTSTFFYGLEHSSHLSSYLLEYWWARQGWAKGGDIFPGRDRHLWNQEEHYCCGCSRAAPSAEMSLPWRAAGMGQKMLSPAQLSPAQEPMGIPEP